MEKKFYDCTNDVAFKMMFTKKENEDLLKMLIYDATGIDVDIKIVSIPEVLKENIYIKGKILDVLVKDKQGNIYNIEMNTYYTNEIAKRNIAYMCNQYSNMVKISEDYNKTGKLIQINFICNASSQTPAYDYFTIYCHESKKDLVDNFIGYNFVLSNDEEFCYNKLVRKLSIIPLLRKDKKQLEKMVKGNKLGEKFMEEIKRINADEEFAHFMTAEEDNEKMKNTLLNEAHEKGIKKGIKSGIQLTAKNMLENNIDIETIEKVTGLSKEEIGKILWSDRYK